MRGTTAGMIRTPCTSNQINQHFTFWFHILCPINCWYPGELVELTVETHEKKGSVYSWHQVTYRQRNKVVQWHKRHCGHQYQRKKRFFRAPWNVEKYGNMLVFNAFYFSTIFQMGWYHHLSKRRNGEGILKLCELGSLEFGSFPLPKMTNRLDSHCVCPVFVRVDSKIVKLALGVQSVCTEVWFWDVFLGPSERAEKTTGLVFENLSIAILQRAQSDVFFFKWNNTLSMDWPIDNN